MATEQEREHRPEETGSQQPLLFGTQEIPPPTSNGQRSEEARPDGQREQPAAERRERAETRPTGALVRELFDESSAFVRAEVALARKEMKENITSAQRGIASMASGGAVLLAGLHALVATAILALALVWAAWVAALVVGLVTCAIGGVMVVMGRRKAQLQSMTPERTVRTLGDSRHFARDESRHAMEKWR